MFSSFLLQCFKVPEMARAAAVLWMSRGRIGAVKAFTEGQLGVVA